MRGMVYEEDPRLIVTHPLNVPLAVVLPFMSIALTNHLAVPVDPVGVTELGGISPMVPVNGTVADPVAPLMRSSMISPVTVHVLDGSPAGDIWAWAGSTTESIIGRLQRPGKSLDAAMPPVAIAAKSVLLRRGLIMVSAVPGTSAPFVASTFRFLSAMVLAFSPENFGHNQ